VTTALKVYHVKICKPATPGVPEEIIVVRHQAEEYKAAWVSARTVCRMGSNARRIFKVFDDTPFAEAEEFVVRAGVYTVKHIFVEDTRKRGKTRMTTITGDELLALVDEHCPDTSPELRQAMKEAIQDGGVRITQASARRLGLMKE
jgi:hypothetical protein